MQRPTGGSCITWCRSSRCVHRPMNGLSLTRGQGNIRVFCRVRPLLPSDVPSYAVVRSGGSNSPNHSPEDEEAVKERLRAEIAFPDKMDNKEIVLRSSSESATGQERKDEWQFSFDRVGLNHS